MVFFFSFPFLFFRDARHCARVRVPILSHPIRLESRLFPFIESGLALRRQGLVTGLGRAREAGKAGGL